MTLTLHTVTTEVGENAEPVGSVHGPHIDRHIAQSAKEIAAPHLNLTQMLFGHYQQHQGHPSQFIDYDDYVLVRVTDLGRGLACNYLAKYAVMVGFQGRLWFLIGLKLGGALTASASLRTGLTLSLWERELWPLVTISFLETNVNERPASLPWAYVIIASGGHNVRFSRLNRKHIRPPRKP